MKKSNGLINLLLVGVMSSSVALALDPCYCGTHATFASVQAPFILSTDRLETQGLQVWQDINANADIIVGGDIYGLEGIYFEQEATKANMVVSWFDADTFIIGYPHGDGVVDVGDGVRANFPLIVDNDASHDILHLQDGSVAMNFGGDDGLNNHNVLALTSNNSGANSDVGFSMENKETDFQWTFRTYEPGEGFAASKIGTGGTEFQVDNLGTGLSTTVVRMGGVVVFKDGHLVDTRGNELASLVQAQSVKLATVEAETKIKNQEIAMMKAETKAMKAKIAKLETMQKKVAMMESILTNLALDTSNTNKEKVSMK